jgi:hypothetical protein
MDLHVWLLQPERRSSDYKKKSKQATDQTIESCHKVSCTELVLLSLKRVAKATTLGV